VEIVYLDSSANVATTDAPMLGGYDAIGCLSSRDLSGYEFISVTKQGGFIPISLKPIDNRLNIIM
jgi:allophanate hydrolase subunit 2